jgi:ribonucleoside-diphosphate reductase alpha chain
MNLTQFAEETLRDRYLQPSDGGKPLEAFYRAATAFADDREHAERMFYYVSNFWMTLATPTLSNAPVRTHWSDYWDENFKSENYEKAVVGLPISCFLNYVPDSRDGLADHYTENIWLASNGGGIGGYWGHVRSDGAKTSNGSVSTGSIPFMHVVDSQMLAFNQGKTRRGSYAAYMDISHPEIIEFIEMRKPTGGDVNRKCLNLHHGINITDEFMELVEEALNGGNPTWNLVDPNSGNVVSSVPVKLLWEKIINTRATTGEPYLHFIDTSNRALPEGQREKGLRVLQSNLCSEITLPTGSDRTAVCCLASLNLENWDEWKDNELFIPDLVRYLDNVLEYFINNAKNMPKAVYSASQERSIGIGTLGFHALLQKRGIPFESALATSLNRQMFKHIKEEAVRGSIELAFERGEAHDISGSGIRNAHLLSIAPNASSSIIANTSPSVEPWKANAFTHKTLSGSHLVKNKYLERLLESKGLNTKEIWKGIISNGGSVQHLKELDDYERDIYKTADELDQRWIVDHAADRQPFICQSQSINLFIPYGMDIKDFSHLHVRAWKKGLKTLYYCRSAPTRRAENLNQKVERMYLTDNEECLSCQA